MFDELVETHVSPEGAVTQKRTLTDDPLNGEAMRLACEKLVAAHKKFERLDSDVRKYTVKEVNLSWWDALNRMSEIERRVWRLFVGEHPTPKSNEQYAAWRNAYLKGEGIKVDA